MWTLPGALLWIPTAANLYLAGLITHLAWNQSNGVFEAQADFEIAMLIAAISLPISCALVLGWVIWAVMRFAVRRVVDSNVNIGALIVSVLNTIAPVVLWFGLKWVAR